MTVQRRRKYDKYKHLKDYKFKVYENYPNSSINNSSDRKKTDTKKKSKFYLESLKKSNNNHK